MGLGETAEGGATVIALLLLLLAVVVGIGLLLVVRRTTGRWRPALLALLAWTLVIAAFPVSGYLSADSRDQRRARALRESVSVAAGIVSRPYGGSEYQHTDCRPSNDDPGARERGWDSVGTGELASADVLAVFAASLEHQGFVVSRGHVDDHGYGTDFVEGVRGRSSVAVTQAKYQQGTGQFVIRAEDGCNEPRY